MTLSINLADILQFLTYTYLVLMVGLGGFTSLGMKWRFHLWMATLAVLTGLIYALEHSNYWGLDSRVAMGWLWLVAVIAHAIRSLWLNTELQRDEKGHYFLTIRA